MAMLTVTSKGQVTLRKELLEYLGVRPGDKIELELQPHGEALLRAARKTGSIRELSGMLAGLSDKVLTIEEINQAAAEGWAGRVK